MDSTRISPGTGTQEPGPALPQDSRPHPEVRCRFRRGLGEREQDWGAESIWRQEQRECHGLRRLPDFPGAAPLHRGPPLLCKDPLGRPNACLRQSLGSHVSLHQLPLSQGELSIPPGLLTPAESTPSTCLSASGAAPLSSGQTRHRGLSVTQPPGHGSQ